MVAGTRYAHDDGDFKSLLHKMDFLFRSSSASGSLTDIFPLLKKIVPGLCRHHKIEEAFNELKNFFRVSFTTKYYRKCDTKGK
jgi:hypothetical protein